MTVQERCIIIPTPPAMDAWAVHRHPGQKHLTEGTASSSSSSPQLKPGRASTLPDPNGAMDPTMPTAIALAGDDQRCLA